MRPGQLEIDRLRREVAKLKAERGRLKKAAAVIAKHRSIWPMRAHWGLAMRRPGVSRSGFHAWLDVAAVVDLFSRRVVG